MFHSGQDFGRLARRRFMYKYHIRIYETANHRYIKTNKVDNGKYVITTDVHSNKCHQNILNEKKKRIIKNREIEREGEENKSIEKSKWKLFPRMDFLQE